MDPWSPRRLQDLSIDVLAERKRLLVCGPKGVEWKDSEMFLNSDLADKLLERLSYEGNLDDSILSTFTNDHVHLQHVSLFFNSVTGCGLKVLKDHKLTSLHIATCPFDKNVVCKVLKNIGNKSFESLQHLAFWWNCQTIPDATFCDRMWPADDDFVQQFVVFETLSRFNCLRSLDVRGTDLTNTNLAVLGKSLSHVENLDLSWNSRITDISPLKNFQKTLKSLSLAELFEIAPESTMVTFVTLSGLTFLDISLRVINDSFDSFESIFFGLRNPFTADILLQTPGILPNLVSLDLSCRTVNSEHELRQFLDAHQFLKSLVLCGSNACSFKSLQDYRPRLTVGGTGTLEQYTAALRYYNRREKHRQIPQYENCTHRIVGELYLNLDSTSKPFPPCLDDQLVQELLDFIPTRSSFLSDNRMSDCEFCCLVNIALLLEKGIITHLEPDTKRHLLHLCHKTMQQTSEVKFPEISHARETAREILESLGEPVPPQGDQIGTEEDIP